jgi:carbonic anhydrase/acetyltransferase-like protein (isoleucine patch superfamily)
MGKGILENAMRHMAHGIEVEFKAALVADLRERAEKIIEEVATSVAKGVTVRMMSMTNPHTMGDEVHVQFNYTGSKPIP